MDANSHGVASKNLNTSGVLATLTLQQDYFFQVVEELKQKEPVTLIGDGRCDSPGHSAKYCTFTLMEPESKKIVASTVVSVTQVSIASKSLMHLLSNRICLGEPVHYF
eukprot:TCONS_00019347-protein